MTLVPLEISCVDLLRLRIGLERFNSTKRDVRI